MGRTVPTYRQALDERLKRWDEFARLLARPRRSGPRSRRSAPAPGATWPQATFVGSPDLLESILLSVLLDLARRLPPRARVAAPVSR